MEGLIGVIIWICVIFVIIKKVVANSAKQTKSNKNSSMPANKMPYIRPQKAPSGGAGSVYSGGATPKTYKSERATHTMMEDRSNDWLANQLSEERKALYRTNSMFGQQMEHRQVCDAKMLKEYHLANCNADGIDLAEYK